MAINLRVIDNFTLADIVLTAENNFSLNFSKSNYKFDWIYDIMFTLTKVYAA